MSKHVTKHATGHVTEHLTMMESLKQQPEKFNFFLALRSIECAAADQPRLGMSLQPGTDPVRLTQTPSLAFGNSTLHSYEEAKEGRPARLSSVFLGLFGPHGALPAHLTEYAKDRIRFDKDPTFVGFLDIFHHRMLSLFYRAWANKEPTVNFDRPASDKFKKYLGALFGLDMDAPQMEGELPNQAKLFFAGAFVNQKRNANDLEGILSSYFKLPVTVQEFVGEWVTLPLTSQWRLGESKETGMLGQTTLMGAKVWGCQNKFRLHFGPLMFSEFKRLLPGGSDLKRVKEVVKNYVGFQFGWDISLKLKKGEMPASEFGAETQLGWSTWLHSDDENRQYTDVIISGSEEEQHG